MPFQDAAAERRKQLAAQLLRGEEVMVTQQGAIRSADEHDGNEVAITVPEGKLAARSLYWYERDPELLQGEVEAMQHFFPQFRRDRLPDGRMSWLGSLASGVPGSHRLWHLQVVYDHDHPHNDSYGGSINVYPIEPDLASIEAELGEPIPHTLRHQGSGELSICTVEAGAFRSNRNHSSTAASSLAWAAKWIAAFELWMLGELSSRDFAGHRI
ncbi:hypothetical protein KBZ20_14280 [Vulcanococcus limneticus Candia 3F8]|uniref:hypothetical protein n=1 Tax=Vulcanococcus limneticus TaxID=2170428 RepID=UPI000B999183|nr:hypothetical protein [Vulcanococcus limneticus]MCP9793576.1 hypothetical protein [Vulcanococcus limneticus MW73D5]MCP9894939.1 hypothetical protein [Vulcanococcus limneticus Candia 3F8]MCP9898933.1 hypothetical protein [Vulcanococcus limneticus Candia 3B3]